MLMIATHALPAILIWRTDMSKATVESVMKYVWAMRAAATEQILAPCGANIGELEIADAALRAEVERLAAQAEPAPAPVGEYPALPEPKHRGPSGTGSYFDAYSADQMRAYIDADRAQRPAREVRLLTPQEIVAVLEGSALWYMFQHMGWYSAPEMSFKRHGKSLAEELLRAACKANGLTVKEQS